MDVLKLVVFLKGLNEVMLMALLGQAVLWLLAGESRDRNFVYLGFRTATAPLFRLVRRITPAAIGDRHVPALTFAWLFAAECVLVAAKIRLVLSAEGS